MVSMICKPAILGQSLMIPLPPPRPDEVPADNFAKDVRSEYRHVARCDACILYECRIRRSSISLSLSLSLFGNSALSIDYEERSKSFALIHALISDILN